MWINFSIMYRLKRLITHVFMQLDHVPSKHELALRYMVTVVKNLWSFMQTFLKHLSPELRNYL